MRTIVVEGKQYEVPDNSCWHWYIHEGQCPLLKSTGYKENPKDLTEFDWYSCPFRKKDTYWNNICKLKPTKPCREAEVTQ